MVRGIRGATTVEHNDSEEILQATSELLTELIRQNSMDPDDIASVFITVTPDLDATFPARAIRDLEGWQWVPLMCSKEIAVPGSLPRCIRLMIMVNTEKGQKELQHVYLKESASLRPDLIEKSIDTL